MPPRPSVPRISYSARVLRPTARPAGSFFESDLSLAVLPAPRLLDPVPAPSATGGFGDSPFEADNPAGTTSGTATTAGAAGAAASARTFRIASWVFTRARTMGKLNGLTM